MDIKCFQNFKYLNTHGKLFDGPKHTDYNYHLEDHATGTRIYTANMKEDSLPTCSAACSAGADECRNGVCCMNGTGCWPLDDCSPSEPRLVQCQQADLSHKVFGIWLRNSRTYCDWSTKIKSIIAGKPKAQSIILILGNYMTALTTTDGSSCDTGLSCYTGEDEPSFKKLISNALQDINNLYMGGFLKEIWLNINGYAAYYECFQQRLGTVPLDNYISMRTAFKEFKNIPFKISWDLEGPATMPGVPTRTMTDLGFPGDQATLKSLVTQFYGLMDIPKPDGNVLTLGGDQSWWYGYNSTSSDGPTGLEVIRNFTSILNNPNLWANNKITDVVPMLYDSNNLKPTTSQGILTEWKNTMDKLQIYDIKYYFSALVNDNNTCQSLFEKILNPGNEPPSVPLAGILVWDGGINKNLTSVVNSYYNEVALPACPIHSRIYIKNGNIWTYNIFWRILAPYSGLTAVLGPYWNTTYSNTNLNGWTSPAFANLPYTPPSRSSGKLTNSGNAVTLATALKIQTNNSIVSYATLADIPFPNGISQQNIYFVEGIDLAQFMSANSITKENSSSTDPIETAEGGIVFPS